ncbi:hypothetical protein [Eubacterium pyruvativorans]|uniref:hypothetical protein n=1 Tax=Eubacterium pyruvativorans TaxID=155865 RepID=UPI00088C65E7|nr:hypothetical protein [Eubacterium pyruvativorans]SDF31047.1 hypothetical protein SAMN04487889_11735 [Eubacterium pyruvativorans]
MANEKNLIPFTSDQSREKAVKNGRKGGIASGKARRRAKSIQEMTRLVLQQPLSSEGKLRVKNGDLDLSDIDEDDVVGLLSVVVGLFSAASEGSSQAAETLRKWYDGNRVRKKERLEQEKMEAEIDALKAKIRALEGTEDDTSDDGFLEALRGSTEDDWKDDDDDPPA